MCPGERGISAHETNMSVCRSRCRPSAIRRPLSSSKRANQIAADFVNGLLEKMAASQTPSANGEPAAISSRANRGAGGVDRDHPPPAGVADQEPASLDDGGEAAMENREEQLGHS